MASGLQKKARTFTLSRVSFIQGTKGGRFNTSLSFNLIRGRLKHSLLDYLRCARARKEEVGEQITGKGNERLVNMNNVFALPEGDLRTELLAQRNSLHRNYSTPTNFLQNYRL